MCATIAERLRLKVKSISATQTDQNFSQLLLKSKNEINEIKKEYEEQTLTQLYIHRGLIKLQFSC